VYQFQSNHPLETQLFKISNSLLCRLTFLVFILLVLPEFEHALDAVYLFRDAIQTFAQKIVDLGLGYTGLDFSKLSRSKCCNDDSVLGC